MPPALVAAYMTISMSESCSAICIARSAYCIDSSSLPMNVSSMAMLVSRRVFSETAAGEVLSWMMSQARL